MIQKTLGEEVLIFDGGAGTARETKRKLQEFGLLNKNRQKGNIIFENSLESAEILELSRYLLEHHEKR